MIMGKHLFSAYIKETFTSIRLYAGAVIVSLIVFFVFYGEYFEGFADLNNATGLFLTISFMRIIAYTPACLPIIAGFCDDCKHQYIRSIVARSGVKRYTAAKFASGFISAFLVVFLGMMIAMSILSINHPVAGINAGGELAPYSQFELMGVPALTFIVRDFIFALYGAMYASAGFVIASLIPNKFLTFAVPPVLCFICEETGYALNLPPYINLYNLDVAITIFRDRGWLFNFLYTVFFALVIAFALYIIFDKLVEKRVRCELN